MKTRVESKRLGGQVLELLETCPHTVIELAELTGFSIFAIQKRLRTFEDGGYVHRQRMTTPTGHCFLWHHGRRPADMTVLCVEKPNRPTYRIYPAVNRRDPLVAALFGPAKPAGFLTGILTGEAA